MRVWSVCLVLSCLASGTGAAAPVAPAAARVKPAAAPRAQPPITATSPQPAPRAYRVLSVAELRPARAGLAATKVNSSAARRETVTVPSTLRAAGARVVTTPQPYATGKGVVLDAKHPLDGNTNSGMVVCGVLYNSSLKYELEYSQEDVTLTQEVPSGHRINALTASFRKLPAGSHTYLLTLGHSADPKYVTIKVNDQEFAPDKLTYNAATSEMRLLFTYDPAANGDALNAMVYLTYPESAPWDFQTFHHVQLAVLD